jgi:uncharacterized beta-barrel protein YwiB (DUF1934 family)
VIHVAPVQEIKIELTSAFSMNMSPPDMSQFVYSGQLYFVNGAWYIKYVEQEEDGQTYTTLKVKEDEIMVIRNGLVTMRHSYRPGIRTSGSYAGPGGMMWMDTATKEMQVCYDKEGDLSAVVWTYDLYLNEQKVGRYRISCRLMRI